MKNPWGDDLVEDTGVNEWGDKLHETPKAEPEVEPTQKGPRQAAEGESDFMRGMTNIPGQLENLYGSGKALAGVAATKLGAEDMGKEWIKSGMEHMESGTARTATKDSDDLTDAWDKGIGSVLTDWLPYQMGAGVGNLAETLGFMGAGAVVGSLTGAGVGAVPGAVAGAVSKALVRKGIKEAAENILEREGKAAAEKYVATQTAKELAQVEAKQYAAKGARAYGTNTGMAMQAGFHGMGEVGGRVFDEAEKQGINPENVDLSTALPAAAVHAVADYVSEKITMGAFKPMSKDASKYLSYEIAKRIMVTGSKELIPEEIQTIAERYGAKLSLTDAAAIQDYINTAGASFAMSLIPSGTGAVMAHVSRPAVTTPGSTDQIKTDETKTEEPAVPLTPEQEKAQKELDAKLAPATLAPETSTDVDETNLVVGQITNPEIAAMEAEYANRQAKIDAGTHANPKAAIAKNAALRLEIDNKKADLFAAQKAAPQGEPNANNPRPDATTTGEGAQVSGQSSINEPASPGETAGTEPASVGVAKDPQSATGDRAVNKSSAIDTEDKSIIPSDVPTEDQTAEAERAKIAEGLAQNTQDVRDTDQVLADSYDREVPQYRLQKDLDKHPHIQEEYELARQEATDQDEELDLPAWEKLTPDEKYIYLGALPLNASALDFTRAAGKLNNYRKYIQESGFENDERNAIAGYEEARPVYSKVLGAELPYWGDLSDGAKQTYIGINKTNAPVQQDAGMLAVAHTLGTEGVINITPAARERARLGQSERVAQLESLRRAQEEDFAAVEKAAERQKNKAQKDAEREQKATEEATGEAIAKDNATPQSLATTTSAKRVGRIESAVNNGDINEVLSEIADDKHRNIGVFAKNLLKLVGALKLNAKIEFGKVKAGASGRFSPSTNTITLSGKDGKYTGERDLSETVVHEIAHYLTDHVIDNRTAYLKTITDPVERKEVEAALNRLVINFKQAKDKLGDKFDIPTIKEFIAEAFSNPAFQSALINLDRVANDKRTYAPATENAFTRFVKNVAAALGIRPADYAAGFKQLMEDIARIISVPNDEIKGKSVSYAKKQKQQPQVKKAEVPKNITLEGDDPAYHVNMTAGAGVTKRAFDTGGTQGLIEKFQNFHQRIKFWEDKHGLSGLITSVGDKLNNIYTQISLSAGRSVNKYREHVAAPMQRLQVAFSNLASVSGKNTEQLLQFLHKITIALHEPERRMIKYMKEVPLNNTANLVQNGKKISVAGRRDQIFKLLDTHVLTKAQAEALRSELNALVFETDANGKVLMDADNNPIPNKKNVDPTPGGYTQREGIKGITAFNDPVYTVTGMNPDDAKQIRAEYEKHKHKEEIDAVLAPLRELNDANTLLNKEAGYWSDLVNNYVQFYGWKNYVPMKVSPNRADDEILNFDSRKHGAELQEMTHSFDGSFKPSNNSILQTMSDAARAAARAGRGDLTLAIRNAVQQKLIPNSSVKRIEFKDRDQELPLSKKENSIFHYNKDGSVDVVTINDPKLRNSIRRTYEEVHPTIDLLNKITGTFGKMHTRYNYAFAPMNFVRDIFTNAFNIGADMGPVQAAKFLSTVSARVLQGGLAKAGRVAYLYENNKITELRALAKTDPYIKDMWEYLETGGMVSYTESLSLKNKMQVLNKGLGRNKVLTTMDQADKFVDVWNNMFEFASRAAAYSVVKNQMLGNKVSEEEAKIRATTYVKNLMNFEQVGQLGKMMGAWFMFFRPSATGAVRALESIAPAFQSVDRAVANLPDTIKNNPKALEQFKQTYAQKQTNARIMAAALIGLGAATYYMSAMMAPDDDLGRNSVLTDNMAQWTRYARFHIPNTFSQQIGMGKDVVFQMPWGFGLGAFSAAGAQIAAANMGKASASEAMKNIFASIALDSFLPLPISKMDIGDSPLNFALDTITPSAVRPLLEFAINKDGLGRGIYNESYRKMVDAYVGGDRIPEIYKGAARYVFDATNGQVDVSPNTLYFLANSYIDGASRLAETADGILDLSQGRKEFNAKNDTILFSSFFGTKSNVDNREFASIQSQMLEKEKILNAVKTNPEQYLKYIAANPMDEGLVKAFNKDINGELKKLQTYAKETRMMPGLSPKERQGMLEGNLLMQRLIKSNFIEKYKAYDIKP